MKYRIERRLLDNEPFFEFQASTQWHGPSGCRRCSSSLPTSSSGPLPVTDTLAGFAERLAWIAQELSSDDVLACLNASIKGKEPPAVEFRLGSFVYNDAARAAAAERSHGYKELYAEIYGHYSVRALRVGVWVLSCKCRDCANSKRVMWLFALQLLARLLERGMQMVQALCYAASTGMGSIGIQGAAVLTPGLAAALLDPARRLPRDTRRQALATVCAVS